MTTAHRPTFHGAIATDTPGGNRMLGSGTQHLCARNLPGELKLKFRSDLEGKSILEPEDGKKAEKPLEALQSARDADVLLESSDDEDSEDSDAELQRELERVRKERQAAAARKLREEEEKRKADEEAALHADPHTIIGGGDQATKRRWDDDVLFKNQARDEPEAKRRFINDTVRNDFHRKFMERYMR